MGIISLLYCNWSLAWSDRPTCRPSTAFSYPITSNNIKSIETNGIGIRYHGFKIHVICLFAKYYVISAARGPWPKIKISICVSLMKSHNGINPWRSYQYFFLTWQYIVCRGAVNLIHVTKFIYFLLPCILNSSFCWPYITRFWTGNNIR